MSSQTLEVKNPYTNKTIGTIICDSQNDIEKKIALLKTYKNHLTGYERYQIIKKVSELLLERKEKFSELITQEIGISLKDSRHEVERSFHTLTICSEESKRIYTSLNSSEISPIKAHCAIPFREPIGLVGCITPFNHPLNQVVHKAGPAIAANNAVLLKPSEKCPLTAQALCKLFYEAGLPENMLQMVVGDGESVGRVITQSPEIDFLSFTGSTRIGELITQNAGLKKLSLELGGNDALVICPDFDLVQAATIALNGAFSNSGQRCSSVKRILIFESIADDFLNKCLEEIKKFKSGSPFEEDTVVGTLINEAAAKEVESRINEAVSDGAKLLYGGKRNGALMEPALMDYVLPHSRLVSEETFGPVAPVMRIKNLEEAISVANQTDYGLNAGILTHRLDWIFQFSKNVKVGGIRVNEATGFRNENIPFGGIKKSGFGRSGVQSAIEEMTNLKTVVIAQPFVSNLES